MSEERHDKNTGLLIAIVAIILLLIGVLGYFIFGKTEVKDAIDDTTESIENINDNNTKTATDVKGSYQAILSPNTNTTTDEEADDTSDNYIELVLSDNNTAKLVNTTQSTTVQTGTYTVGDTKVTIMINKENDTQNANQTYEFTINDENLEYNGVTLNKVDNDTLKYIK